MAKSKANKSTRRVPAAPAAAVMPPASRLSTWHAGYALVLLGAAVFATSDAWRDIWNYAWNDEESSQVLLVPLVVTWLVWVRRHRLAPTGATVGLVLIGAGWALSTYGYRARVQTLWHGGAVVMAFGCVATALGWPVMRRLLPAVFVLLFLIPVPSTGRRLLAVPLQTWTAQMTQAVCETFGMAVERSGNLLLINGTSVAVAEACNGMRMVFTLFLVCYTFAFVTPLKAGSRLTVLVLSPVVAMVCNVIRLVPTVYVFGHYSKESGERFHDIGGWVMLILGYLLLSGVVGLKRWMLASAEPSGVTPVARPRGGVA